MAIRVLLADDHRLILEALERTFAEVDGIEIVGTANDGRQVVPLIARTNPDIVLLDMRMPEMDGLSCLERIRKQHPRVKVVMLSASDDAERVRAALKRGANPLGVVEGRQHHDLHPRMLLADPLEAGEPVHLGHPHVQEDDVRVRARDQRHDLPAVVRRAHDLDPLHLGEGPLEGLDDQPVVIRKQNPDRHFALPFPQRPRRAARPSGAAGLRFPQTGRLHGGLDFLNRTSVPIAELQGRGRGRSLLCGGIHRSGRLTFHSSLIRDRETSTERFGGKRSLRPGDRT